MFHEKALMVTGLASVLLDALGADLIDAAMNGIVEMLGPIMRETWS